jgi:Nuclease-related domain/UvrD-like helicase C-terminal domain/AAA domain
MAIMIPNDPADFNQSEGEAEAFEALRKLDNQHYIFHSLRWLDYRAAFSAARPKIAQGEADFAVFHPKHGILVIEVKSGGIRCANGCWFQKNRFTGIEKETFDPEKQATRSVFALKGLVDRVLPFGERCRLFSAVWFPSVKLPRKNLPPNYAPEMILDVDCLRDPSTAIHRVFSFWEDRIAPAERSKLTPSGAKLVLNTIAPTFSVVPSMRAAFESREKQFVRLTSEQCRILEFLDEQKTAVIAGAAGTGKTVLAVEKAKRLSSEGQSVLFLCFNSGLRKFLKTFHNVPSVTYHTFHSLASSYVQLRDCPIEQLASRFIEILATDNFKWEFNNVVVDEGQDFEDEWLEWLALRNKGAFYVFYDPMQNVFRSKLPLWVENAECRLVLKRNCRNTIQIARTSSRCIGRDFVANEASIKGTRPILYNCSSTSEAKRLAESIVRNRSADLDLKGHEIALLSMHTIDTSVLSGITKIGRFAVSDEFTVDAVCFTTVRKFKGLEAKLVVVMDVDLDGFKENEWKTRLYVGASRAMHELHVIVQGVCDDSIRLAIAGLAEKRKVAPNRRSFANLLDVQWFKEAVRA